MVGYSNVANPHFSTRHLIRLPHWYLAIRKSVCVRRSHDGWDVYVRGVFTNRYPTGGYLHPQ